MKRYTGTMTRKMLAAALSAALILCSCGRPSTSDPQQAEHSSSDAKVISQAIYEEKAKDPSVYYDDDYNYTNKEISENDLWEAWSSDRASRREAASETGGLSDFSKITSQAVLLSNPGENTVYSPVNLYMALAMLAETTDGQTREEILSLMQSADMDTLRSTAEHLWKACYADDGVVMSLPANSIWLSSHLSYEPDALNALTDHYKASSFIGEMGSDDYNQMLRKWINEQTGSLLKDQAETINMDPATFLALVSTLYFKGAWSEEFSETENYEDVFYSNQEENATFMHQFMSGTLYYEDDLMCGTSLNIKNGGAMWFFLPKEDQTPETLIHSGAYLDLVSSSIYDYPGISYPSLDFSLPKFDVVSDLELTNALQSLGISSVFDPRVANFSAIQTEEDDTPLYLDTVKHAARVKIDEKGCEAASLVIMLECGAGLPDDEKVLKLDRPFLFVLTNDTGLPLFTGTVYHPQTSN